MKIGILGFGEVGSSIAKVYSDFEEFDVRILDLNRDDGLEGIEILNVCIPYNAKFKDIVLENIKKYKPKLVLIHSTVAPGITKTVKDEVDDCCVAHTPIRGLHPNLYEGIKTFIKFIGADDAESREKAMKHLKSLGLKTEVLKGSKESETGKLFDTTYYGLVIAWHGEMKKFCDENSVNFEDAITKFNESYNEGYLKLGKKNVVRPVLYPPEGKIGGHCVINNAKILEEIWKSKALDLIMSYS